MNLNQLQQELKVWQQYNFGNRPTYYPLLGVAEELGELSEAESSNPHIHELTIRLGRMAHGQLKEEQKIRVSENHAEKIKDAIADLVIFLADYCNCRNIDLGQVIADTWYKVQQRDWKKFPVNGRTK